MLSRTSGPAATESPEACLENLYRRLDEAVAEYGPVDALGVGTASMVDFRAGRVVLSTNLPLRDVPLRDLLSERYGVPVVIDNDANVACLAEYPLRRRQRHERDDHAHSGHRHRWRHRHERPPVPGRERRRRRARPHGHRLRRAALPGRLPQPRLSRGLRFGPGHGPGGARRRPRHARIGARPGARFGRGGRRAAAQQPRARRRPGRGGGAHRRSARSSASA